MHEIRCYYVVKCKGLPRGNYATRASVMIDVLYASFSYPKAFLYILFVC